MPSDDARKYADDTDNEAFDEVLLDPCPRCQSQHPALIQTLINGGDFKFWTQCPVAGQPILIRETESGELQDV